MLHKTALTKWPLFTNFVSKLYKIMVNEVTFVSFRVGDHPSDFTGA